ncbi:MAG: hypothetical protein ACXAEU_16110, partial [Candidatus Hodarchaeales archaeon]
ISYYTQWKLYLAMNDCPDDSLLSNVSPGFALPPSRAILLVRGRGASQPLIQVVNGVLNA